MHWQNFLRVCVHRGNRGGGDGGRRRIAMNKVDASRDRATSAWVEAHELRFSPLSLPSTVLGGRERETEKS